LRYELQNKKDSFAKRATILFLVIGKLKIKAKNVRLKMCPDLLKNFIRRWIRRWRKRRTLRMRRQVLGLMAERS